MKTSFSNERAMNGKRQDNNAAGPTKPPKVYESTISLDETEQIDPTTTKYLAVKRKLPVTAGDLEGLQYEKYIVRFDQGTPKRWLSFIKEWQELATQLNLTTGPAL